MSPGTVATLRVGQVRIRVRVTGYSGPGRVFARSDERETYGDSIGQLRNPYIGGWRNRVSIRVSRLTLTEP